MKLSADLKNQKKNTDQPEADAQNDLLDDPIRTRVEYHRDGVALMPRAGEETRAVAYWVMSPVTASMETKTRCRPVRQIYQPPPEDEAPKERLDCTCPGRYPDATCDHMKQLINAVDTARSVPSPEEFAARFKASVWFRLAELLHGWNRLKRSSVTVEFHEGGENEGDKLLVFRLNGSLLLSRSSSGGDVRRLAERLCVQPPGADKAFPIRAVVLKRLRGMTQTEEERRMSRKGMRSRRQSFEEGFWYRVFYHCFHEFGPAPYAFRSMPDEKSGGIPGHLTISCQMTGGDVESDFRFAVPGKYAEQVLACLTKGAKQPVKVPPRPRPARLINHVSLENGRDLAIRPVLLLTGADGEARRIDTTAVTIMRYGQLLHVAEMDMMIRPDAPLPPDWEPGNEPSIVRHDFIPYFLARNEDILFSDSYEIDPEVKGLNILGDVDSVRFRPDAVERDWCWLSVRYGFGGSELCLAELIAARKAGKQYVETPEGWVKCDTPALREITRIAEELTSRDEEETGDRIAVSWKDLFRLNAVSGLQPEVVGNDVNAETVARFLDMKPSQPPPEPELTSRLRTYQVVGLHWLWWLYENRLGGLLCDDMGLGKTHQVMALMDAVRQAEADGAKFLVVCPTTVMSHWEMKIRDHAPRLSAVVHHGIGRHLKADAASADVVITSYGVLLRDIEVFRDIRFSVAVFDEIQQLKNPDTKTYKAATALNAAFTIGMTGTPIENSVKELKALMDVVVPGFLGSDRSFKERYVPRKDISTHTGELRRLIYPFTLRRLKKTVLDELPEKIEDIRFCELSDDQISLYRDAVAAGGNALLVELGDDSRTIPYIHVFALLTLLKQICDHPAIVSPDPLSYDGFISGKWELFKELLAECLDSGQKVVVYSQFVGMIEIMTDYLEQEGIGHVALTGASRNRGRLIERFNTDPDCRVFVGSLKAGGTGIDLVAGSVVIHYDRWWNAAKEDQATDRVHRIGQQRGVQVFKLVTAGTLEDKISAIIEGKRALMESIVREDDPGLLKSFSREELIDMLKF